MVHACDQLQALRLVLSLVLCLIFLLAWLYCLIGEIHCGWYIERDSSHQNEVI